MSKFMEQFGKLKSIVLRQTGRDDFEKDADGKAFLTAKDKEVLGSAFTPALIEQFEKGLSAEAAVEEVQSAAQATVDQLKADNQKAMQELVEKVNAATKKVDEAEAARAKLEEEKVTLKETVDVLAASVGDDDGEVVKNVAVVGAGKAPWLGVKPNAKHFHTQMALEYLQGNTGKAMGASSTTFGKASTPGMAGNTINVDEVYDEFGTYLSQTKARLEILQVLTQKTESQKYMTTKSAITEWRASSAAITNVVQQFVAKWTPLATSTFTPIVIKNRHHKVNLPITPDDINDSWLSYLYDEQMTVDQMPVTRFIIEKLLRPKIDQDIELLLIATGEYEDLGNVTEGQAGQATGKSMDGYITTLKKELATGTSKMNFFSLVDGATGVTDANIVDQIEAYVDWVEDEAPLYAKAGMYIFIDPSLHKKYKRKYRELYPTTKNEDKNADAPDFSNLTFVPLNAMRGSGVFFSTPKENFVRLIHKNAAGGETKLFLQVENYTVKVFAEFWLGVGFALAELVFAYVPAAADASGSGA